MVIALEPAGTEFDRVLECDKELPPEEQSVFRLRYPKLHERKRYEKKAGRFNFREGSESIESVNAQLEVGIEVLKDCLVGWSNLRDGAGEEIVFEQQKGKVTDECLERIAPYIAEIANACIEGTTVTKEQAKNS